MRCPSYSDKVAHCINIMIFTGKTRHKSTKHGEITSGSRDGSGTTTCGNTIETTLRFTIIAKNFFDTTSITLRPNGTNVLSFCI